MRLGIFGGSFNPVHYGHLLLAECCREQCHLDEVWFVPAATPPHKPHLPLADEQHRLIMLEKATQGNPAFRVNDLELRRSGISYTFETLQDLKQAYPDVELFFLMGADSLKDLPQWREPATICQLAIPVVVRRPNAPPLDWSPLATLVSAERMSEIEQCTVEMPLTQFSSTDLRRRAARGQSLRYRTPDAVIEYMRQFQLYQPQ